MGPGSSDVRAVRANVSKEFELLGNSVFIVNGQAVSGTFASMTITTLTSTTVNATTVAAPNITVNSGGALLPAGSATSGTSDTNIGSVAKHFNEAFVRLYNHATWSEHLEDFLGEAGDTLPGLFGINAETGNSTEDYVTDSPGGIYSLINSSDTEAQSTQLFSLDNLWISLDEAPVIEIRLKLDLTGTNTLGSADQRFVVGVCSAHTNAEDDLDATTVNAWFRLEGVDSAIYLETDDGTLNDDDNDSGVTIVDDTYTVFRIDFRNTDAVTFFIDGGLVGSFDMGSITSGSLVQPIVCLQRDGGAEEEKVFTDYIHVSQAR